MAALFVLAGAGVFIISRGLREYNYAKAADEAYPGSPMTVTNIGAI